MVSTNRCVIYKKKSTSIYCINIFVSEIRLIQDSYGNGVLKYNDSNFGKQILLPFNTIILDRMSFLMP